MTTNLGRATGPQERPPRQRGASPQPATQAPDPGAPPAGPSRTDEDARRAQYTAVTTRTFEQLELMLSRMEEMPDAAALRGVPTDDQLGLLCDLEMRITRIRVELDQVGCAL